MPPQHQPQQPCQLVLVVVLFLLAGSIRRRRRRHYFTLLPALYSVVDAFACGDRATMLASQKPARPRQWRCSSSPSLPFCLARPLLRTCATTDGADHTKRRSARHIHAFNKLRAIRTEDMRDEGLAWTTDDDDEEDGDDEEDAMDIHTVSDAEALLAVRAYLQRKNRLQGWTRAAERKRKRALNRPVIPTAAVGNHGGDDDDKSNSNSNSTTTTKTTMTTTTLTLEPFDPSRGFFWENPSELKYWRRVLDSSRQHGQRTLLTDDLKEENSGDRRNEEENRDNEFDEEYDEPEEDVEEEEEDELEDEIWETVNPRNTLQRVDLYKLHPPDEDELDERDSILAEQGQVGVFDAGPSLERIRRSDAAKRMWSNPEWKARWYQQRWGSKRLEGTAKTTASRSQIRRLEKKLREIQPDLFLAKEEVAALTEDEIAVAIQTYLSSKRKRSASSSTSGRSSKKGRRFAFPPSSQENRSTKLPRDALLIKSVNDLQAARQRRCERAAAAYRKRLERQQERQTTQPFNVTVQSPMAHKVRSMIPPSQSSFTLAKTASPHAAMRRIEEQLAENKLPSVTDVEIILQPGKLSGRKPLLLRILRDCFDLFGRCIPEDFAEDDETSSDKPSTQVRQFATAAPVQHIGAFVLYKLRKKIENM